MPNPAASQSQTRTHGKLIWIRGSQHSQRIRRSPVLWRCRLTFLVSCFRLLLWTAARGQFVMSLHGKSCSGAQGAPTTAWMKHIYRRLLASWDKYSIFKLSLFLWVWTHDLKFHWSVYIKLCQTASAQNLVGLGSAEVFRASSCGELHEVKMSSLWGQLAVCRSTRLSNQIPNWGGRPTSWLWRDTITPAWVCWVQKVRCCSNTWKSGSEVRSTHLHINRNPEHHLIRRHHLL